ncbi:MAG TPA: ribbon-helix-helix protein, CopG family [Candidatus Thermoplasmatota archaeon]|nr:ribbon-helix-helix protein, CopG family [Candidatus Thermoplasmatota archaeon]
MLSDDQMLGIRRNDPSQLKPLKVRLPLSHVLELHRMRIVGDRSVSEIVEDALREYMKGLNQTAHEAVTKPVQ